MAPSSAVQVAGSHTGVSRGLPYDGEGRHVVFAGSMISDRSINLDTVTFQAYRIPREFPCVAAHIVHRMPFARREIPSLVDAVVASRALASNVIAFRKTR
jgi:hypothetical protein